jgi:hypothetical protein
LKVLWNAIYKLTGIDASPDIAFRDFSYHMAEFRADYQSVAAFLSDRNLKPLESAPGETRLQILGVDMRSVQIVGTYYEISLQVPLEPVGDVKTDLFAHLYLPVNTEKARWGGVDVNGFPKFLATIEMEKRTDHTIWRLAQNGSPILELGMEDRVGEHANRTWTFVGHRKNQVVKTVFEIQGVIWEGQRDGGAFLNLGTHPISETLRSIVIDDSATRIEIGHRLSGTLKKPVRL